MAKKATSPFRLLRAAYKGLGYANGDLCAASAIPPRGRAAAWLDKGQWLSLADSVGAEKVFFVDNNPVVVFAQLDDSDTDVARLLFNKIWCMARPQLLFLASPGLLSVYDLTAPPARDLGEWGRGKHLLDVAETAAEVQDRLCAYRYEQVQSGRLFAEKRFGNLINRADKALVRDIRRVRDTLMDMGLSSTHAHLLIARSIFVRYLEDREVLTPEYFQDVAGDTRRWRTALDTPPQQLGCDSVTRGKYYLRVLRNKAFTYALFGRLARDFNGDILPFTPKERAHVTQEHLDALREFLLGNTQGQARLFFFAYRFDIIPINLISSIYEEFYNSEKGSAGNQGSYYTRSSLVEFILSQTLTNKRLSTNPLVLDPACGSGIFLVEAFRRIVRYRVKKVRRRLRTDELRKILRDQLAGIEVNREAARVAAFSLSLALLHYQSPSDIRAHKRLPKLVYDPTCDADAVDERYDTILAMNAFNLDDVDERLRARFGPGRADVLVGNPPWGYPGPRDVEGRKAAKAAVEWCRKHKEPLGNKELSQAFINRAKHFLAKGGTAGLLVSSGTLFKTHANSVKFRRALLETTTLRQVVNFVHVRDVFFSDAERAAAAIAPFVSLVFDNSPPKTCSRFSYWSVKKTPVLRRLQSVLLSRADLRIVRQSEIRQWDRLWKIYWWGTRADAAFISALELETRLSQTRIEGTPLLLDSGDGFKRGDATRPGATLGGLKELPVSAIARYGPMDRSELRPPPKRVERYGNMNLYRGVRVLVKECPTTHLGNPGSIVARLATKPFCFRDSIYGLKVGNEHIEESKVILAVLWSSLSRYYFFLTASSWGTWKDKILLDEIRQMPFRVPQDPLLRRRIVGLVDELMSHAPRSDGQLSLLPTDVSVDPARVVELEKSLDEAVFDLFEVSQPERVLVRDMCRFGLDLFYRHVNSDALQPVPALRTASSCGTVADLPNLDATEEGSLEAYLCELLLLWNEQLAPDGEFSWEVLRPAHTPMVAVVLRTQERKAKPTPTVSAGVGRWQHVLRQLAEKSTVPLGANRILVEGMVRAVTDTDVVVIKRDERRLWTRSSAREDAEATLLQAIRLQGSTRQ